MSRRLSLLFLHDASSLCETLARQALAMGDRATLVLPPRGLMTYPELADSAVVLGPGRRRRILGYAKALAKADYDIVVAGARLAWVMGAAAKTARGGRMVAVLMGSDIRRLPGLAMGTKALLWGALRRSDFIYFASPDTEGPARSAGRPCDLLRYPIDQTLFSPKGDAAILDGDPVVFIPTRLDSDKGNEDIVSLVRHVLDQYPSARINMVRWKGTERALSRILSFDQRRRVSLLEFVRRPQLPRFYRGSTVLVGQMRLGFGSMTELEAMSCGVPVVFYDRFYGYGADQPGSKAIQELFDKTVVDEGFRRKKVAQGLDLVEKTFRADLVYRGFREKLLAVLG